MGLLAIVVLYTFYSLYIDNLRFVEATSRNLRHMIRLLTILATYGIGVLAFGRDYPIWLVRTWHFLYLGLLVLLLLLAGIDAMVEEFAVSFRNVVISLHEFLISPVPYVVAGIVSRIARTGIGITS
jgi:hypothetical protein